jgi:hypothetical protein
MKNQILKIIIILTLSFNINNANEIPNDFKKDYNEIVNSFKLIDTRDKELSKTFKINGGEKITAVLEKLEENSDFDWQEPDKDYIQHIFYVYKPVMRNLGEPNYWVDIGKYDQKLFSVACIASDDTEVFASIVRSSYYLNNHRKHKLIKYAGFVAQNVFKMPLAGYDINGGLFEGERSSGYTAIPIYNPKEFYPYYNEEKILERLYETGTCDREATKNANIEVLVGDKWIPQEQSWSIQSDTKTLTIKSQKQPLYSTPNIKTKK